tara:strand:+ start:1229 stop:1729 length:501 start_codon:yes stop_codon:yes gene_type:complete
MHPFEQRINWASAMAKHPNIRVTNIEEKLGTTYTAGSLAALKKSFPKANFVWIMGADNLKQISRWHRWTRIFNQVPIAVFDRAPYSFGALSGKAARAFCKFKKNSSNACSLADMTPPAWMFFHTQLHPGSSSKIRKTIYKSNSTPSANLKQTKTLESLKTEKTKQK